MALFYKFYLPIKALCYKFFKNWQLPCKYSGYTQRETLSFMISFKHTESLNLHVLQIKHLGVFILVFSLYFWPAIRDESISPINLFANR